MITSSEELLHQRYRIERPLGAGGQGQTYLASDDQTGQTVVLKELTLGKATDWKALELFEREARILQSLDHPRIPRYIDSFHLEEEGRFFLVQQYVSGETLDAFLQRGQRFHQNEALHFLEEILHLLSYLHGLSPPVVHRDIKPANLIVTEDGSFVLIDFGAVQDVVARTVGGSTMVGTSGFMPPEQIMGRTGPPTDLYGLAATVVHLTSGIDPGLLPLSRMKLQFREKTPLSAPFLDLLDQMLEPELEDRIPSTARALEILEELRDRLARGKVPHQDSSSSQLPSTRSRVPEPRLPIYPVADRFRVSTVSLAGASLRIEITPPAVSSIRRSRERLILILAFSGFFAIYRLYFLTLLIIALYLPLVHFRPPASYSSRLLLSPSGLRLTEVVTSRGKEKLTRDIRIPLEKLRSVELIADSNRAQKGIRFLDADHHAHLFHSKSIFSTSSSPTYAEIEVQWLFELCQAHLSSLQDS